MFLFEMRTELMVAQAPTRHGDAIKQALHSVFDLDSGVEQEN